MANVTEVDLAYRSPRLDAVPVPGGEVDVIECDMCDEPATRMLALDDGRLHRVWSHCRLMVCDTCWPEVLEILRGEP